MANVTLENTREHDITLSITGASGELVQVTIPAARQNHDDKTEIVYGRTDADNAVILAAKKSPVVEHYFDEGWLRVAKPVQDAKQTRQ